MKLLGEPRLHVPVIGAAFFFFYGALSGRDPGVDDKTITVIDQAPATAARPAPAAQ